jgi:hypothetical protein
MDNRIIVWSYWNRGGNSDEKDVILAFSRVDAGLIAIAKKSEDGFGGEEWTHIHIEDLEKIMVLARQEWKK